MAKNTNKRLREEVEELKEMVSILLNSWKSKHPEDFEVNDKLKLIVLGDKYGDN